MMMSGLTAQPRLSQPPWVILVGGHRQHVLLRSCRLQRCQAGVWAHNMAGLQVQACSFVGCTEGLAATHSGSIHIQTSAITGCGGWSATPSISFPHDVHTSVPASARLFSALSKHRDWQAAKTQRQASPSEPAHTITTPPAAGAVAGSEAMVAAAAGRRAALLLQQVREVRITQVHATRCWGPSLATVGCEDMRLSLCCLGGGGVAAPMPGSSVGGSRAAARGADTAQAGSSSSSSSSDGGHGAAISTGQGWQQRREGVCWDHCGSSTQLQMWS